MGVPAHLPLLLLLCCFFFQVRRKKMSPSEENNKLEAQERRVVAADIVTTSLVECSFLRAAAIMLVDLDGTPCASVETKDGKLGVYVQNHNEGKQGFSVHNDKNGGIILQIMDSSGATRAVGILLKTGAMNFSVFDQKEATALAVSVTPDGEFLFSAKNLRGIVWAFLKALFRREKKD
jgi:hypothetical protein